MSLLPVVVDAGGFLVAAWLVLPAVRRTGLGIWHPAVAWLALELGFFGIGAAILAIVEHKGAPALYVGGAVAAFGLAVAVGDRIARRRAAAPRAAGPEPPPAPLTGHPAEDTRPAVVVGLVVIGALALLPSLLDAGIPFLAGDITGARSAIGGLDLQPLRVALPAAVLIAVVVAARTTDRRRRLIAGLAVTGAVAAELALASRYLSAELIAAIVLGLGIGRRPLPVRALVAVGLIVAALFVGVGILRAYDQANGREVAFAVERTVNRVLLIEPRTLDALQTVIPAEQPHFDGLTWVRRVAPWFGRDDVPNLGYWIYPRLFPGQVTPGYAAPGLIGEAWANFGWFGLAVFAALGLFVERLGALIARRRRLVSDVVAAALLTLFVARTHAVGLDGLAVVVGLAVVWRLAVAPVGDLGADVRRTVGFAD